MTSGEPCVQSTPTAISSPRFARLMHFAFRRRFTPSFLHDLLNRQRYVFILTRNQSWRHFNNRDLAAESAKHLAKFQADIAAADDRQMPRQEVNVHHGGICKKRNLIEPGREGMIAPSAHIDKDPRRGQAILADADFVRRFKSGMSR